MRTFLIAGNWKMNTNINDTEVLINSIQAGLDFELKNCEVLVCPPFTNLLTAVESAKGTNICVGAQNCFFETKGAFTGEVSVEMIKSAGCKYVIIGHSERRTYFGETDELINKKAFSILQNGLKPIICIGETLTERQNGETFTVLSKQIKGAFKDFTNEMFLETVIAYEPVWAIGTGVSATSDQAQDTHKFIRGFILSNYGEQASEMKILYGGSMNDQNADELLALPDVDGGLIGGAALKANAFVSIIKSTQNYI